MPLDSASLLAKLFDAPVHPGEVQWIGLRPYRRAPLQSVNDATLEAGLGLVGDRYANRDGKRQVTLIPCEDLVAIASFLRIERAAPGDLRRNIVVRGLNLTALKARRFTIGSAVLEATGECHPCSRMEETFGPGGYNAVRGRGGITARVLVGGPIRVGDRVERLGSSDAIGATLFDRVG